MPVYVSIDYDGCLSFLREPSAEDFDIGNQHDELIKRILFFSEGQPLTVMIGSNRQSIGLDRLNQMVHQNGSALTIIPSMFLSALRARRDGLTTEFDPFLLADISEGREAGDEIRDKTYSGSVDYSDASKVLLLYAQCHRAASMRTNDDVIDFHFIDDREDILYAVYSFYRDNSALLPPNFNLHLHYYSKNLLTSPEQFDVIFNLAVWPSEFFAEDDIEGLDSIVSPTDDGSSFIESAVIKSESSDNMLDNHFSQSVRAVFLQHDNLSIPLTRKTQEMPKRRTCVQPAQLLAARNQHMQQHDASLPRFFVPAQEQVGEVSPGKGCHFPNSF